MQTPSHAVVDEVALPLRYCTWNRGAQRNTRQIRRCYSILALTLAGIAVADQAPKNPDLGAAWFARLRDPQTRIEALYQHDEAAAERNERIEDREKFALTHRGTLVFRCPQPRHPGAWAVVRVWQNARDLLRGPNPTSYPAHPLEIERRRIWDAATENLAADFKPWQVGQPWFETLSGYLVDASGKQLGEMFFGSPAIIADFDSDGMLDFVEIERLHVKRANKADALIDCVSIGPLASVLPRKAMMYCNLRDDTSRSSRMWRFTIRRDAHEALQLVLVPTAKDRQEITYQFRKGKLVASVDKPPPGILVDTHPTADDYGPWGNFLERHGLTFHGVGSDPACELDASLPSQPSTEPLKWSLPDTSSLPPREAAQAMVGHQFDDSFKTYFELASVGEPVPPATQGWLERCEGGGFGGELHTMVWWFVGDSAQQWTQKDSAFIISDVSPKELGRQIAIIHELDGVRAVPKTHYSPECDHCRGGGDDMWFFRVRSLTNYPARLATVFDECYPSLWHSVGLKYDRDLASVVAALYVDPTQRDGRTQSIRGIAPIWLDVENAAKIPPPLIRAAVRSIGENHWREMKPQLEKFQLSLGPVTQDEQRLAEIDKLEGDFFQKRLKLNDRDEWLAEREFHTLARERVALAVKMTGDLRYELREQVRKSLAELEK